MKRFYKALISGAAALGATTLIGAGALSAAAQAPNMYPPARYVQDTALAPGETAVDFRLSGYVFGIKMISARYKAQFDDRDYMAYSDIKTSGLGALLKKLRIWATTDGFYDDNGLYPVSQTQQNLDKKSRRVEMRYDYDARKVSVDINPPIGSQGVPPASPQERFEADDVISAILNIMMQGQTIDGEFCNGSVRVFDSKQHYALRMERDGTDEREFDDIEYDAIRCLVYYEPINGFDPEDLPDADEAASPVKVYFAKREDLGLYIPLRMAYKISGFTAVIKLKDMTVRKG